MSISLFKNLKWFFVDQFMFWGGSSGGGGGPTQSTTVNTNIPEYARPYVENMLQSTQAQIYNDDGTSFRPYQPYSSNPQDYVASFSPLQEQSQATVANMKVPGQYGVATGLAGQAGLGGLAAADQSSMLGNQALGYGQAGANYGATGQMYGAQGAEQALAASNRAQTQASRYGGQGAGYGASAANLAPQAQQYGQNAANIGMGGIGYGSQAAGYGSQAANMANQGYNAGSNFAAQATNPNAVAAYMSPYQQNVTDYQKSQAVRDYQMAAPKLQAAAVGQGAFGGNRMALQQSEAQRGLMSQLQGIQAQGTQNAFQNAQAQQQFGANLGLQGLQAGYQGSGMGIQGAQAGMSGLNTAMQGQQAGLAGLNQAGNLYGQGIQGAQAGLQGVGQQISAGNLGLQGTAQGIQGAQAGMQGAQTGLQGVGQATQAGQYGLQGYGLANTAAGTLGTLGTNDLTAQANIAQLQSQAGAQQQAQQQQMINQQIQDYATAQQYPFMQLGMMNSMLRGLPLQSTTTQQYQAQPSTGQQLLGYGLGALGAYKAFG
jgi:hypothetical protein